MTGTNENSEIQGALSGSTDSGRSALRGVILMAVPVVITTSSRAIMDFVDYSMITHMGSSAAQAAILPAQTIMWSYIVFGMGIVSVVNTFASQCLGRNQHAECSAYAWQGLYLAVAAGIAAVALIPTLPGLIELIGHEPAVQQMEITYSQIAILTAGPSIAAAGLGWFFIGIHRPWITTWSVIEANIINTVVSYVLIFGKLGVEPMGIAGAAWGTLAGVAYRSVRLTLTLFIPSIASTFPSRKVWKPSFRKIKDLCRVGLPCGFHWMSEVTVWTFFINVLVGTKFGTAHLIATNSAWQFLRISFMPTLGVGQALTALVGKSLGLSDSNRAIREARIAAGIALAYMGTLSLIYVIFRRELIGWFSDDPEVIAIAGSIMICAAVFQLFDALGIIYSSALRGAGDTFVPSMIFVVWAWVFIMGGGWCAVLYFHEMGSLGPWIAASTSIIVTSLLVWRRWHGRAWMKIDLFRNHDTGTHSDNGDSNEDSLTTATT